MKNNLKKHVIMALSCVMLVGSVLTPAGTAKAECNHSPEPYGYSDESTQPCGVHSNCNIVIRTYYEGVKCKLCNGILSIRPTTTYVEHRR